MIILSNSIYPIILLWAIVIAIHFFQRGYFKYKKFRFSILNYYLLLLPLVSGLLIYCFKTNSFRPLAMFASFSIFGIIGEILVNSWWQIFYGQRFWVYNEETILHRYSSFLNLIPWGIGGFLYLGIINRFAKQDYSGIELLFLSGLGLSVLFQLTLRYYFWSPEHKFHKIGKEIILFYFPIFALVAILGFFYGKEIYILVLLFGFVATVAEYLFGKACSFFISKKLWNYNYMAIDQGHFTPLSIPLFILGGFGFWIVSRLFI